MIEWSSNYELGIEKVDKQHRCLVDLINKLTEIHNVSEDRSKVEAVFHGLIAYCNYHFENEEMVMQECDYPDFDKHRHEHDLFFNNVEKAKLGYINGDISSLSFLIEYLQLWIIDHIVIEDRKYASLLMQKF